MKRPKKPKSIQLSARLEPTAADVLQKVCEQTNWSQASALARALHAYKELIGPPKKTWTASMQQEHAIYSQAAQLHALEVKQAAERRDLSKKLREAQGLTPSQEAR